MKPPKMHEYADRRAYRPETIDKNLEAEIHSRGKTGVVKTLGGLAIILADTLALNLFPEIVQNPSYSLMAGAITGAGGMLTGIGLLDSSGYLAYRLADKRYPRE